ncbi:MAG: 4-hydroxythreonine-4-phosphate dehydrogenase PdxA [Polyangiaceae bacterium]|nr:4-hydroxythreonine-4-phosphate dehydrogenase PdxA [Polyangiaceae bacterium]
MGCPAGVGPEVAVMAAARRRRLPCVIVGDEATLYAAAELVGVSVRRFVRFTGGPPPSGRIAFLQVDTGLSPRDRVPGKPTRASGRAQLAYVNAALDLARGGRGRALVTGPVSKSLIARSGAPDAARFLGHTEWLRDRDRARATVMCFASPRLVTSLATTHLAISELPRRLDATSVSLATYWLGRLLLALDRQRPRLAVCSLNPHAGETELMGDEERQAILPGLRAARRRLGATATIEGPIGAETAFRKAYSGTYDGVVAMYHDQATIPLKLVAFGSAVNVTMGLSVVRTSVDHGTAYDIAWQGTASPNGMLAALDLAARLVSR